MTPAARKLRDAMRAAVGSGGWEPVPDQYAYTIRWRSAEKTPAHPELVDYDQPYRSLVFLSLVAGKVVLGIAAAPWVRRRDSTISFKRAYEVLVDPETWVR